MARIIGIDYGTHRTGIAVTDPEQLIATGLCTVESHEAVAFLKKYCTGQAVSRIVVGEPRNSDNTPSAITPHVNAFVLVLRRILPEIPVERMDERFTTVLAKQAIMQSGITKKKRSNKALYDMVSATLLLQSYLDYKRNLVGSHDPSGM